MLQSFCKRRIFFLSKFQNILYLPAADDDCFKSIRPDLLTFFANNPDFEFGNISVDDYTKEHGDRALKGVSHKAALTEGLKTIQGVFQLTQQFVEIRNLLDDGIHSARDIVQVGEAEFVKAFADRLGGRDRALEIYYRAAKAEGKSTDPKSRR